MVKKVVTALVENRSSGPLDTPPFDDTSFSTSYALMIGAAMAANLAKVAELPSPSNSQPPRIRPPHHLPLSRDHGIVKPKPRKGVGIPGLPGCRLIPSVMTGALFDCGLDIGGHINALVLDLRTTASTTASLDLLAPGLSGGQNALQAADLAEHLEQLVCH